MVNEEDDDQGGNGGQNNRNSQVSHVAVKIPPFWNQDAALWFKQVEASFAIAKITQDETKFNYVISNLEQKYLSDVRDIVNNPPLQDKYTTLKNKLILENSETDIQRLNKLFSNLDLGDKKPSTMLREMKTLAGENVIGTALENLFYQRLPDTIKAILTASTGNLEAKANLADKIMEMVPQNISQVSQEPLNQQIEALRKEMHSLFNKKIPANKPRDTRNRSKTPNRKADKTTNQNNENEDYCWFHNRFGDKARRCREPCSFRKSGK
jgi:hypothetical protein